MKIAQAELARKQASFANAEEENDFYRIVVLKAIDECLVEEIDGLTQLQTIVASRSTANAILCMSITRKPCGHIMRCATTCTTGLRVTY